MFGDNPLQSMAKIIGGIFSILLMVGLVGGTGYLAYNYIHGHNQLVEAQVKATTAVVDAGQSKQQTAAIQITVAGAKRDAQTDQISQDNVNAIQQAPGAGTPIDPALVHTADVGLCDYESNFADPVCIGLHKGDTTRTAASYSLSGSAKP